MKPGDRVLARRYMGKWAEGTYLGPAPPTETTPTNRGHTTRMLGWVVEWDDGTTDIVRGPDYLDPPIKPIESEA